MQYFQFKVLCFLLWISLLEAKDYRFFINSSHTLSVGVKSYKELRDEKIIKQDLDYSCGAASLATILTFYYGRETSEEEILQAMDKGDNKSSFEDMAKALPQFGFKAQGFAASFEQLSKLKIPVVVYLKHRKSDHFSIIRGINEKTIWLADPSLGNRTLSKEQFLAMYDTRGELEGGELFRGKFLAILPLMPQESKQDFFNNTIKRQTIRTKKQIIFREF